MSEKGRDRPLARLRKLTLVTVSGWFSDLADGDLLQDPGEAWRARAPPMAMAALMAAKVNAATRNWLE